MTCTAVVLKMDDRHRLLARMSNVLMELKPAGFSTQNGGLVHHMTCYLGACREEHRPMLGEEVILRVDSWGLSRHALAMGVSSPTEPAVHCDNRSPHITVAVNPREGGKPRHSNDIEFWFPLAEAIYVLGTFKEFSPGN